MSTDMAQLVASDVYSRRPDRRLCPGAFYYRELQVRIAREETRQ